MSLIDKKIAFVWKVHSIMCAFRMKFLSIKLHFV
jgi:hypothetical protein